MFYASGVEVAPGGVELSPWRSQEVRGSPELQKGGLRALEEAWMTTFIQVEALLESFFLAIRQETGLLDSLGRLDPADRSVQISVFALGTFSRSEWSPTRRG